MPETDESALLERLRSGDKAALGELLTRHQRRLYNICLRLVGNRDDAAELTQEALLKALRHIDGFRGTAQIATWLTRIVTNEAISHLRRRRLRRTASLDAGTDDDGQGVTAPGLGQQLADKREPSPERRVQNYELEHRIQAALDRLEPDFRAVLVLRDIDQMDYQQIAATLEVPVGTVKSRLFRARLALRSHLSETEQAGSAAKPDTRASDGAVAAPGAEAAKHKP